MFGGPQNDAQAASSPGAAAQAPPRPLETPPPRGFELDWAVLLAGYAFETYNKPETARWERGEDGCDVALLSDDFLPSVYKGVLQVNVLAAEGLRNDAGLGETLLTGGRVDPYVLLNVVESAEKSLLKQSGPGRGAVNRDRQGDSVDVQRTATMWRSGDDDRVTWGADGGGEIARLYVKDPRNARLGIRVFDENVAKADDLLGANELELESLLGEGQQTWNGSVPLLWKEEEFDWGMAAAGATAAAVTGIATGGAALAAGAAAMLFKAVSPAGEHGRLFLQISYIPFQEAPAADFDAKPGASSPIGATPGVNWEGLTKKVGGLAITAPLFEFIGFVSNRFTNTEAGLWRNRADRRLILAFRGTQQDNPRDWMTDLTIMKTPWRRSPEGEEPEPTEPEVHAGFREALASVSQRLKALIAQACGDEPSAWEIFVTGHSLGGALATLMATDLAGGLDVSQALPQAPSRSWFNGFKGLFGQGEEIKPPEKPDRKFARLALYTYGATRVGDKAFSTALDEAVPEHFRVVNGQDVVARYPRGGYVHSGRTALLLNASAEGGKGPPGPCRVTGLWLQGETTGACPTRADDVVTTSPFERGALLGRLVEEFQASPLQELREATDRLSADAAELRRRLDTVSGAAREELSEFLASAEASVDELRAAEAYATTAAQQLKEVKKSKENSSLQLLSELEENATDTVAKKLQKALDDVSTPGLSKYFSAASSGDFAKAATYSKTASEAAGTLQAANSAAASALEGVMRAASKAGKSFGDVVGSASLGNYASLVGFDSDYIDQELKLMSSLGSGEAIASHLEPSYYAALSAVADAWLEEEPKRLRK